MKCMYPKMMMTGMWMTGMRSWKSMCRTRDVRMDERCGTTMKWDASCKPAGCDTEPVAVKKTDLVHTALEAGAFNTLVQAIKASGLEDTLLKAGPFTVFAPNDEAFAALPAEKLEDLLKPENQAELQRILSYHIIPGEYTAAEVGKLTRLYTLNGKQVKIHVKDGDVKIDESRVIKTDVMGTNGVIHVIDGVLMPE